MARTKDKVLDISFIWTSVWLIMSCAEEYGNVVYQNKKPNPKLLSLLRQFEKLGNQAIEALQAVQSEVRAIHHLQRSTSPLGQLFREQIKKWNRVDWPKEFRRRLCAILDTTESAVIEKFALSPEKIKERNGPFAAAKSLIAEHFLSVQTRSASEILKNRLDFISHDGSGLGSLEHLLAQSGCSKSKIKQVIKLLESESS